MATVNITYRLSAYGENQNYQWPEEPKGWVTMDKGRRAEWARRRLKMFNAQAIFVSVS